MSFTSDPHLYPNPVGKFKVVVEAIIEKDQQILITQRSPHREQSAGEWETLTGRVAQGESLVDALLREVWEETKLKIKVVAPFHTFHFYRGPKKIEHLGVSFHCLHQAGSVQLDMVEQIDYRWVDLAMSRDFIDNPGILATIDAFKRYKNY